MGNVHIELNRGNRLERKMQIEKFRPGDEGGIKNMAKQKMYQRPDGLYEKKLTLGGKRVVFRAKTQREVMQKIAAYQERKMRGPTFGEVADEWWEYKEARLSPNTVSSYHTAYRQAGGRAFRRTGSERDHGHTDPRMA